MCIFFIYVYLEKCVFIFFKQAFIYVLLSYFFFLIQRIKRLFNDQVKLQLLLIQFHSLFHLICVTVSPIILFIFFFFFIKNSINTTNKMCIYQKKFPCIISLFNLIYLILLRLFVNTFFICCFYFCVHFLF